VCHCIVYPYSTASAINNAVASKYGKCWYEKFISWYGFDSIMEDEKNTRYRGSALVGTPKGTSHQWVYYCDVKMWPFTALWGLQTCDHGHWVTHWVRQMFLGWFLRWVFEQWASILPQSLLEQYYSCCLILLKINRDGFQRAISTIQYPNTVSFQLILFIDLLAATSRILREISSMLVVIFKDEGLVSI